MNSLCMILLLLNFLKEIKQDEYAVKKYEIIEFLKLMLTYFIQGTIK